MIFQNSNMSLRRAAEAAFAQAQSASIEIKKQFKKNFTHANNETLLEHKKKFIDSEWSSDSEAKELLNTILEQRGLDVIK